MIKDKIKRADTYYDISENLKTGFLWLANNDLQTLADGRYEISDNVYANIQTYLTKDDALYEAHREYIDIQYMVCGEEQIGVTDYSNCSVVQSYDSDKDIEFLKNNTKEVFQSIREGEFVVLFPHDAHKPSLKISENKTVKKVVVKVHI